MNTLEDRYRQLRQRIANAALRLNKPEPTLLAVSKKHSSAAIHELYQLGQRDFGESYWQEADAKLNALSDLNIVWHFIGPLQSNKTRPIAEHFAWVHSVDREKIARRLSEQRPDHLPDLKICLQVNIDREETKAGVLPEHALALAKQVTALPKLKLAGLMCIPAKTDPAEAFQRMAGLQAELKQAGLSADTLSMGMSDDLELAIAEGSTMLRIGTALFGERE